MKKYIKSVTKTQQDKYLAIYLTDADKSELNKGMKLAIRNRIYKIFKPIKLIFQNFLPIFEKLITLHHLKNTFCLIKMFGKIIRINQFSGSRFSSFDFIVPITIFKTAINIKIKIIFVIIENFS